MRCYICDKLMSEAETAFSPDGKTLECCATCLEIAMDAAYSDGFTREVLSKVEGSDEVETLEEDTYRTAFDCCDAHGCTEDRDDF